MLKPVAIWNDLPCGCSFEELRGSWIFAIKCREHFVTPYWLYRDPEARSFGPVLEPFMMPYQPEQEEAWNVVSAARL